MLKITVVIILATIFSFSVLYAQDGASRLGKEINYLDSLAILLINNANNPDSVEGELRKYLMSMSTNANFRTYPFDRLKALMFASSEDGKVKAFTGAVRSKGREDSYYGYIYYYPLDKWFTLNQVETDFKYFHKEKTSPDSWYGAVYYNIHSFNIKGEKKYIIFGYRRVDDFTSMKLADVLSFEDQNLTLGSSVFYHKSNEDYYNRFLLTYASEAPIKLNFDSLEQKIVFDHLIPIQSPYDGSRTILVPDGSYSAYENIEGLWIFEDKLPVIVPEEAPRDYPILDNRKNRDILGRSTSKNVTNLPLQKEN